MPAVRRTPVFSAETLHSPPVARPGQMVDSFIFLYIQVGRFGFWLDSMSDRTPSACGSQSEPEQQAQADSVAGEGSMGGSRDRAEAGLGGGGIMRQGDGRSGDGERVSCAVEARADDRCVYRKYCAWVHRNRGQDSCRKETSGEPIRHLRLGPSATRAALRHAEPGQIGGCESGQCQ